MVKYLILGIILLIGVLLSGCIQQSPIAPEPVVTPAVTVSETIEPVTTQALMDNESVSENMTDEIVNAEPSPPVMENVTPIPTPTADKNLAFQELVITKLDLIQGGKTAVLASWEKDNLTHVNALIDELRFQIRNNNDASTFPKKMDYVRLNYYDFIDRMTQFTDNFAQAAALKEQGQNSSSNSYVSAGIMAGDRADISDKRIRIFLKDHPLLL